MYQVTTKASGGFSIQEWMGNQFCGHWVEIDWSLFQTEAFDLVRALG